MISCRSLGVHLSKVRSLTLDSWEPEQLKVKQQLLLSQQLKVIQKLKLQKLKICQLSNPDSDLFKSKKWGVRWVSICFQYAASIDFQSYISLAPVRVRGIHFQSLSKDCRLSTNPWNKCYYFQRCDYQGTFNADRLPSTQTTHSGSLRITALEIVDLQTN